MAESDAPKPELLDADSVTSVSDAAEGETNSGTAAVDLDEPGRPSPTVSPVMPMTYDEEQDEAPTRMVRELGIASTPDAGGFVWGTGRRKSSVARVRVRPVKDGGEARFHISSTKAKDKTVDEFFSEPQHRKACFAPLEATSTKGSLEVYVNVRGGGITGQAEAVLLGVARALKGYDPTLENALREHGFLTRDARKVERKKYGQPGARKRFQFSKR